MHLGGGACARLSAVSHELAVAAVAVPVEAGRCYAEAEVLAALARVPEAEQEGLRFFTDEVRASGTETEPQKQLKEGVGMLSACDDAHLGVEQKNARRCA